MSVGIASALRFRSLPHFRSHASGRFQSLPVASSCRAIRTGAASPAAGMPAVVHYARVQSRVTRGAHGPPRSVNAAILCKPGAPRASIGDLHFMPSTSVDQGRDYGFADRALALRKRAGLTQRELGALLGVSVKAIGAWEAGLSYPYASG